MRSDEYLAADLFERGGSFEAVLMLIDDYVRANHECLPACADFGGGQSSGAWLHSEKAFEELDDQKLPVLGMHADFLIRHAPVMHLSRRLYATYAHLEFSGVRQSEACLRSMSSSG